MTNFARPFGNTTTAMKISYKWLKEYVETDLTAEQAAEALTSTGLEVDSVEEVQSIRGGLKGLYVGHVLTCEPHPNSDHLHVTTVDLGRSEPSQIVCGAPNVAAGQKVVVADIGCTLYDGDKEFVIKKSKLRGVESYGMICAEDEIGVGDSHDGIIVLPSETPAGMPAAEYYKMESDWVIEIEVTANRADALSHYGVARDLYAWLLQNGYKTALRRPGCEGFSIDNEVLPIEVEIVTAEACPRYACVSLTGCEVKESPEWLKEKLTTAGLRPINNIVDVTNYIMLAYGQPMHCFDADMVKGRRIVVRTQPEGYKFVTLDGVEHTLGERDLAICNAEEPMCIAGIFGGKGSGTYDTTTNIVLESACFHPTWIRKSARRHGLSTDSSYRFERGVDPNGAVYALKQAAILCRELSGGRISMDIKDVYPEPVAPCRVELGYGYLRTLIGKDIGTETVKAITDSLGMETVGETTDGITVDVPTYRVDVKRPCDVAEDILRIYGYNNVEIPQRIASSLTVQGDEDRAHKKLDSVGAHLAGCGFNEIMNNSLTKVSYYEGLETFPDGTTVKVVNPLSADLGAMRQTLLFGGLETIVRNANRKRPNLRLFETGNCYHYEAGKHTPENPAAAYLQESHLALWVTGKRVEGSWAHPDEESSVWEMKAYVANILSLCGLGTSDLVWEDYSADIYDAAAIVKTRNGKAVAHFGIVSSKIAKAMGVAAPVYYADILWDNLQQATRRNKVEFTPLSKFQAVSRDLALLIDEGVTFAQVEAAARKAERKLLRSVELFDVYQGKNLPAGKKSYAVNFKLQDDQKTLADAQIEAAMERITAAVKKELGAELR